MLTLHNLATVEWPENVSAHLNLIHFLIPPCKQNGIDILMLIFFLVDTYLVLILNVNK